MSTTYTTLGELVEREIAPALDGTFDIDGFVDELRDRDLIVYNGRGFELVTDEEGNTPEFWDIAAKYDTEMRK